MDADVKLLSGSKRSCEGFTSLQDEAEADDASMVSWDRGGGVCEKKVAVGRETRQLCL